MSLFINCFFRFKTLVRVCSLRRFGYLIASLSQSPYINNSNCFFVYNASQEIFSAIDHDTNKPKDASSSKVKTAIKTSTISDTTSSDTTKTHQVNQDRKFRLMKDMAQLRLQVFFCVYNIVNSISLFFCAHLKQAEISQLESSYKNDEINFSPYLIVEVNALCFNLKIVEELSRANKFIIIIPLAGELLIKV